MLPGGLGCIWHSVPTQIQIAKANSFRSISIASGLKSDVSHIAKYN